MKYPSHGRGSMKGKGYSSGSPVKTNSKTERTASSPDKMAKFGNAGNTQGTKLPKGGCARGAKKMGKRRSAY